jgi:hypothetical protein
MSAGTATNNGEGAQTLKSPCALSAASSQSHNKRILAVRHNDLPDGARFTLTSDSQLDDYSSYVEGERFFVSVPQAVLINEQTELNGHGFTEMRLEQRAEDVLLSFRLQQGATVNINQTFNRLDILFLTNERANKPSASSDREALVRSSR